MTKDAASATTSRTDKHDYDCTCPRCIDIAQNRPHRTCPNCGAFGMIDGPLEAELTALKAKAEAVTWFDWSDNDDDAVAAIDALRAALDSK